LARAVSAENSTTALEPLRMRIAALESELGMTQRAHAELTGVLRDRVASLEDTLAKSTSAFEMVVKERSEAQLRDQRQQDELSSLRVELAVRAPLVDEVDVLRSELAKRDALLAELAARAAADAPPPKPRRARAKRTAVDESTGALAGGEAAAPPHARPNRRGELPSV
jgi:chromosome segregation ATPase